MTKQIDLEPHEHSSSYEIKPMSRWWMTVPTVFFALFGYANGFTNSLTWALLVTGIFLAAGAIFCFPKFWLSKADY